MKNAALVLDGQGRELRAIAPKKAKKEAARVIGCKPDVLHFLNYVETNETIYWFDSTQADAQYWIDSLAIGEPLASGAPAI